MRRSQDAFEFKEGTLYPALHQLHKRGYLRSEWRTGENGKQRKYYGLTATGRRAARRSEQEWLSFTKVVNAILSNPPWHVGFERFPASTPHPPLKRHPLPRERGEEGARSTGLQADPWHPHIHWRPRGRPGGAVGFDDQRIFIVNEGVVALVGFLLPGGEVALNCVANGQVLREGPFSELWIQPAAGDAGGALGAALFVWHQLLENPRQPAGADAQQGSLLGPAFSNEEIARTLAAEDAPYQKFTGEAELLAEVAKLLAAGKVVGWFHGRMEFGPRALGSRSILGDPRNPVMQSVLNLKIKQRESFRPFAPSVLKERASEYFALPVNGESPYMLLVAPVLEKHRTAISDADHETMTANPDLCRRVNIIRSTLPAVTHVDYSVRLQTVDEERHGRFYRLLKAFERETGCPVLVNTSFNVRGEPIVCSPAEALRCFLATDMDALVLEDFVLQKQQMAGVLSAEERAKHLATFEPD